MLAVGVLAGWAVGFSLQKPEITRLRAEIARLQARPTTSVIEQKKIILPPWESEKQPEEVAAPVSASNPVAVAEAGPPPREWEGEGRGWTNGFRERTPEERRQWEERIAAEMKERATRQRTNFIAKAKLDESQVTRLDVLVSSMNLRLGERVQEWDAYLASNNLPRSEIRARIMNDVSSVMVLTYDEFDRNMPPNWREEAGPDFTLYPFIEPEIVQKLRPYVGWRGLGGGGGGPRFGPPGGGAPGQPGNPTGQR